MLELKDTESKRFPPPSLERLESLPQEAKKLLVDHTESLNLLLVTSKRKEQARTSGYWVSRYDEVNKEDVDNYLRPLGKKAAEAAREELENPEYIGLLPILIYLNKDRSDDLYTPDAWETISDNWILRGHRVEKFLPGSLSRATLAILKRGEVAICILSFEPEKNRLAWDELLERDKETFLSHIAPWIFGEGLEEMCISRRNRLLGSPSKERYLVITNNGFGPEKIETVFRVK